MVYTHTVASEFRVILSCSS